MFFLCDILESRLRATVMWSLFCIDLGVVGESVNGKFINEPKLLILLMSVGVEFLGQKFILIKTHSAFLVVLARYCESQCEQSLRVKTRREESQVWLTMSMKSISNLSENV